MEYVMPSQKIEDKLAKRGITLEHCWECFKNKEGKFLRDTRKNNQTDPPTLWFIAKTDADRLLKIVFIYFQSNDEIHIKTAYEPNQIEIEMYKENS